MPLKKAREPLGSGGKTGLLPVDWIVCLGISAALLAFCSRSSPLYPINYWVDANCFFTVGKAMMNGLVVYRDIYEQKGPLLYFLHGLAYLVSSDGFLGVYLLESLAFASFLLSALRTLRLYAPRASCLLPAALGALIATSASFGLGDSAEEFCLSMISWPLYWLLKLSGQEKEDRSFLPAAALSGVLAGCVLWIKFNLLGFHLGWIALFYALALRRGGPLQALKAGAAFLLGMLAASVPWLAYFGANRALGDLRTVYFYNNIFLYPVQSESLRAGLVHSLRNFSDGLGRNPGYAVPAAAGLLWILLRPKKCLPAFAKAGICACFALLAAGVYGGGRAYAYYPLILSPCAVLGLPPVLCLAGKAARRFRPAPARVRRLASGVGLALCLLLAYRGANDRRQLGADRSAAVQYQFAQVMRRTDDRPTLLNYGFMDGGFYTAADIVPTCKYFCILNIPLQEMWRAQDECLLDGAVEFVVTRDKALDSDRFGRYRLISSDSFYDVTYFLYRRAV